MAKPSNRLQVSDLPKVYDVSNDLMREATLKDFEMGQSAIAGFGLLKDGQNAVFQLVRLMTIGQIEWHSGVAKLREFEKFVQEHRQVPTV